MSSDLDTTRIVRSWLRTDEHESAARVLDEVLAALDTTPQRRSWWPAWRFAHMNSFAKLAIATAAVVAIAVIGYSLLPARDQADVGGPAASPSPSLSPSPAPAAFPPAGVLAIGQRHSITLEGRRVTFTVPTTDWVSNGSYSIDKAAGIGPDGAGFIFWVDTPDRVFRDPCKQAMGPPIGTSIADLAAGVASVPGVEVVDGPTDATVGGHAAKRIVITIPEDIGCAATDFHLWTSPDDDIGRYASALASTIRTWIIDVDGTSVWFDAETYAGAGPKPGQEIQQIVDSMQFE
jgi:hypothetical protein